MRKVIVFILLILGIIFINKDDYSFSDDMIRFRVVANSNSKDDILIKMKVVNILSETLFKETKEISEARQNILKNINKIENDVRTVFEENNYNKNYNIAYGYNEFPEKVFNSVKYEKGDYESLVVEIGEAKGDNYFCILYPPLCTIEPSNYQKNTYNFKIIEIIKSLF